MNDMALMSALEEMRLSNDRALTAGDALDQKANFVFAGESLLFGVIGAIVATGRPTGMCQLAYWGVLGLAAALFLAGTVVFVLAISPRMYRTALREDRETIESDILVHYYQVALLGLIEGYIDTIADNRATNKSKVRWLKVSSGLLLCMVAPIAILGAFAA